MSDRIKISIIIPVYNVEPYIARCLDSILKQALKEIEIICVDDCSTDGSVDILDKYANNDTRIIVKKRIENKGPGFTRNEGLKMAHGDYIWFVDSDDYIFEESVKYLCEIVNKDVPDIILFDVQEYLNGIKEDTNKICPSHKAYTGIYSGQSAFQMLFDNKEYSSSPCNKIFRRDFLEELKIGFAEDILYEDELFTFEAFAKAKSVMISDKKCYAYCRRVKSRMTSKKTILNYLSLLRIERELEVIINENVEEKYKSFKNYINMIEEIANNVLIELSLNDLNIIKNAYDYVEEHEEQIIRRNTYFGKNINDIQLSDISKVYIYGAGKMGKIFSQLLEEKGIPVAAFIVTEITDEKCREYPVYKIDDAQKIVNQNDIVFIMIKDEEISEKMLGNAIELGFNRSQIRTYTELSNYKNG